VRHVRTLGVCLVTAFALSAIAATTALANPFAVFANCPTEYTHDFGHGLQQLNACTYGKSNNKSFFKSGNALVHMIHPVVLAGGLIEETETTLLFVLPKTGTSIITKVAQPAQSLTEELNPELLPPAEKARYEKFVGEGRTKVTATIETAGVFDGKGVIDLGNLLNEQGTALKFEVQVKLNNPFLGGHCSVGSNSNPINIELTTGQSGALHGKLGHLNFIAGGEILKIEENELVNGEYTTPGATGCGVANGANAAINASLGLPATAGQSETVIAGTLEQSGRESVEAAGF
jgi:hypothetical protein